jgi:nickel/cobalt transporter (NicO) family protein
MEHIWFLAGGLLLGCLHALEADHIVTVSNLVLSKDSLKKSLRLALQWALGHSFTLLVLSGLVFSLNSAFMALMSTSAERMVGATMIFIGMIVFIQEIKQSTKLNKFGHKHPEFSGSTLFGMGVLHGIAGSASIFLLIPVALTKSIFSVLSYVGLFSFGMILTMGLYGLFLQNFGLNKNFSGYLPKVRFVVAIFSVTIGIKLLGT